MPNELKCIQNLRVQWGVRRNEIDTEGFGRGGAFTIGHIVAFSEFSAPLCVKSGRRNTGGAGVTFQTATERQEHGEKESWRGQESTCIATSYVGLV